MAAPFPVPTDPSFLDYAKALGPTVAIAFGLLGVWVSHHLTIRREDRRHAQEVKSLCSAFLGEIGSIIRMVDAPKLSIGTWPASTAFLSVVLKTHDHG